MTEIIYGVLKKNNLPGVIFTVLCGGAEFGEAIETDTCIPLISCSESIKVKLMVQQTVNQNFSTCLLEFSSKTAIIVMEDAYISLAVRSVLIVVVGTVGKRCTTCRRLLIHNNYTSKTGAGVVGLTPT
ncbi:aldehyde dehydrogenase family 7 member B4-like [Papaver somniferum]|uniref:aldehyde dehydrogenase family 7 member B4-like n=1 Tax=Papaver somniferum TaxID=3469 RepID=UPI000E6FA3F5|nr:aldehyde dehydrogenase family 7 member B4-like [Papaver somniferum]